MIYEDYNSGDRTTVVESTNEKDNWINPATVPACELLQLGRGTTVRELSGVRENPRLSLLRIYERARKTSAFGELPVARGSSTACKNVSNARVYRAANSRASKFGEPVCRCVRRTFVRERYRWLEDESPEFAVRNHSRPVPGRDRVPRSISLIANNRRREFE